MTRWLSGLLVVLLATFAIESTGNFKIPAARANAVAPTRIRIGTYDPRAIAIAYARSPLFRHRLDEKQTEMRTARAARDQAKIKELEAWGQNQQMRLHFQGFAGVQVGDILATVKDKLPAVADTANVQLIGLKSDYASPEIETVDVTDDLVNLWSPTPATLKIIESLKKTTPLPVEEIAKMGPND